MIKQEIAIYRILHIDNLALLLSAGGLCSQNSAAKEKRDLYVNIYNSEIQRDRGNIFVPGFSGATIHDFISFYFCPASPMLYSVLRKSPELANHIIYIVADAREIARDKAFIFTDCNARLRFATWYSDINDIEKLKWYCIRAKYWGRQSDPSGFTMQYKMAEFLVKDNLEWSYIKCVAVSSKAAYHKVKRIIANFGAKCSKSVIVKPSWYFLRGETDD